MSQQQFSSPESRLDADTVKRVIERAAKLQQAHLETVSPDQLEALASEVGIDPEFVRRALSEPESETAVESVEAPKHVRRIVRRKVARTKTTIDGLTARDVRSALAPALLYGAFAGLAMATFQNHWDQRSTAEVILLMIQPAILTIYFAQKQPHRRMGALVGLGLGMLPIVAASFSGDTGRGNIPLLVTLIFGPILAGLGFVTTATRKWLDERNGEEIVEEVVVEPAR